MIGLQILWVVVCVGMMGWSFWRFGKSVMEADHMITRDKELSDYYGKIADNRREELNAQSGELAPLVKQRDRLRAEVEELERQTSFKAQFERRRLFLLTDRRASEDLEWHVPASLRDGFGMIWHPAVTDSWIRGRRIVIWAKNKEIARRTVTARLPESSGFMIGEPTEGLEFPALAPPAAVELDDPDLESDDEAPDSINPELEAGETSAQETANALSEPVKPTR